MTRTIALVSLLFVVAACSNDANQPSSDGATDYADSVFLDGRIYTVDEDRSWAEAVAIKDGRFLAVGTDTHVLAFAGPDTARYSLDGVMAMPGIQDSHLHLQSLANAIECTPGQFPPDRLAAVLEECRSRIIPDRDWLVINGMEMWTGDEIRNDLVNEAYPDRPVIIRDVSFHFRLVNAAGLAIAGIDADTPDPEGGHISKDPETGEPTGVLAEGSAISLVARHIPEYGNALIDEKMAELTQGMLEHGITSVQEAAADRVYLESILRVDANGSPTPYVFSHMRWDWPENPAQEALISEYGGTTQGRVTNGGIKVFLDGVPVPPVFTHVPIDETGEVDETNLLVPRDTLYAKLTEWDNAGLKVKMHAAGDGAVRVGLDAIEAVRNANGFSGVMHEIGHTTDISAADIPRFAEINAVAEISPYFWHLPGLGEQLGYQFRSVHEAGGIVTIGSDYSVVESYNPFPPLQGVVTRPGESVSVGTAIDFVTRNAAQSIGRADDMGSIEVGKIANMIVLDRNLFEVDADEIGDTRVMMTILDGEIVLRANR